MFTPGPHCTTETWAYGDSPMESHQDDQGNEHLSCEGMVGQLRVHGVFGQCSQISQIRILGGPVQRQELDFMILQGICKHEEDLVV